MNTAAETLYAAAIARAEVASGGFCVNTNHGVRWPYAAAVWRIDGKLYCDDCAASVVPGGGTARMSAAEPKARVCVQVRARTRVIESTRLMAGDDGWSAECSCGWKTRVYKRMATALRHFNAHADAAGGGSSHG